MQTTKINKSIKKILINLEETNLSDVWIKEQSKHYRII